MPVASSQSRPQTTSFVLHQICIRCSDDQYGALQLLDPQEDTSDQLLLHTKSCNSGLTTGLHKC